MREILWRIQLIGGLTAQFGRHQITRFYTHKAGALFACLAFYPERSHSREELAERFWPEAEVAAGRTSLRAALASLRRQLEPPEIPAGSVLIANHSTLRLNPLVIRTDVAEFEAASRQAAHASSLLERLSRLQQAAGSIEGELLPGYYEEWVLAERQRLTDALAGVLRQVVADCEATGNPETALPYAHRRISLDPLNEESHASLIRLYLQLGQPAAAQRQYQELERLLREQLNAMPSPTTRALLTMSKAVRTTVSRPLLRPVGKDRPPLPSWKTFVPGKVTEEEGGSRRKPWADLPFQFTPFFGREAELEKVQSLLLPEAWQGKPSGHLLTLTGAGGAGKTRLAVAIGERLEQSAALLPLFLPLNDLTQAHQIVTALFTALRLTRAGDREPLDQIAEALRGQPTLLILDNFEQLLADEAQAQENVGLIRALRARVPDLLCLVTSRQTLNLEGEQEYPVPPLPTPAQGPEIPERLLEFASVQLFVDRARHVRPDFQLTPGNAATIAALCERLEGIPLALELAAAWAQMLTPTQMLARLSDRFDLLVSRRRDIAARHRTLRAAIDSSFQTLSPELQRLFARLSVFRGGWTAEEAAAICEEPKAFEELTELREQSLIQRVGSTEDGLEMRFRMLESLREYAAEAVPVEARPDLLRRHAHFFSTLALEAQTHYAQPNAGEWMGRLDADYENLNAALEWTLENQTDLAAHQIGALDWFWYTRGYLREQRDWHARLFANKEKVSAKLYPHVLINTARQDQPEEAKRLYAEALPLFRQQGDRMGLALCLNYMAAMASYQGQFEQAQALYEECIAIRTEVGDQIGVNNARASLASVYYILGNFTASRSLLEEQLLIQDRMGDFIGAAKVKIALANYNYFQGKYSLALELLESAFAIYQGVGARWELADIMRNQGRVLEAQGEYALAEQRLQEGQTIFLGLEDREMEAEMMLDRAALAWFQNDMATAWELCKPLLNINRLAHGGSLRLRLVDIRSLIALSEGRNAEAYRLAEEGVELRAHSKDLYPIARSLLAYGAVCGCFHQPEEAFISLRQALDLARQMETSPLLLGALAELALFCAANDQFEQAAYLAGAVSALRAQSGFLQPGPERLRLEFALRNARLSLSSPAFDAAWNAGSHLSQEDATAFAMALPGLPTSST